MGGVREGPELEEDPRACKKLVLLSLNKSNTHTVPSLHADSGRLGDAFGWVLVQESLYFLRKTIHFQFYAANLVA